MNMKSTPLQEIPQPEEDAATPRIRLGLGILLLGLLLFAIGAKPNWFGWDRSPVVGFVQIVAFITGLGTMCLGGYIAMLTLWWGHERTIISDIGSRLVWTGFVFAVFSGMADIFGMGSQAFPQLPYFGPWQASGVVIGQGIIALGFLLLVPFSAKQN